MHYTDLLDPKFCVDPITIKAFLRASRAVSDDRVQSELTSRSCGEFLPRLYQEWQKRDKILGFCGELAGAATHEVLPDNTAQIASLAKHARDNIDFAPTKTDPRIDSYAARDENRLPLSERDATLQWIRSEKLAEEIIRDSTASVVARRCGGLGADAQQFRRY